MANNTIEIKITADNEQAISALKKMSDFVRQISNTANTDGANAGKGFTEAFSTISLTGNKVISVLESINSAVNKMASSFNPAAKQGKDAMQEITDSASKAGKEIENTRFKLNKFVGIGVKVKMPSVSLEPANSNPIISESNRSSSSVPKVGNPFKSANDGADGFLDRLSKISIAGYGIVGMFEKIESAVTTVFGTGLSFDKQMETAKLGISGILVSMTNWNDQQMDLNTAMAQSQKYIDKINQKATDIGLNPTELIAGFQTAVAPGLKANMNLDEITDIVAIYTKAVKTQLGAQANEMQITQEIRSVLSGSIDQNSTVARNMGITNEGVEQAKQTASGLFKYLQEKMSGIGEVAEKEWPNSMAGALDALKAKYSQASGSAFETVFDTAKVKIKELSDALFVVDEKTKKISFNPEVLSYLQSAVNYSILFGDKVIVAGKFISTYLLAPLNGVGGLLAFIINNLYGVTTALATWAVINKFRKAMDDYSEAAIKAKIETQALGNAGTTTGAKITAGTAGATVAMRRMEAAIGTVKIALRGLASATLWGAIAMAAGWALEKVINWFDKTTDAKNRLAGAKTGAGGSSTGGDQNFGWLHIAHEGGRVEDPYDVVSSGVGDTGGISYGAHQFATNMGTPKDFVDWLYEGGWDVGKLLKYGQNDQAGIPAHDVTPGTEEFESLWHLAIKEYGDAFRRLQDEYAKALYYDNPNSDNAEDMSIALDADKRSKVMQEVVYSTAIQHGRGGQAEVMRRAAEVAGVPNLSYLTDEQAIPYIYEARRQLNPDDINRYNDEQQEAMNALAINPQIQTPGKINDGKISLKEKEQEKKEIANARIKQLEAQASGDVQKYIADLELEANSLEQRYNDTKAGTAENPISVDDYITQRKAFEQAKADKELELIQMKMSDTKQRSIASDLKPNEKIDLQTEFTELQTQYDLRQKALKKVFQELDKLNNDELRQLSDEELELKASDLETRGQIEEATKIRQQLKTRALRKKFIANSYGEGVSALDHVNQTELLNAKFTQTQKNLEYANKDLTEAQETLLSELAGGTISATKLTESYINKFHALMDSNLADLKTELAQAISLGDKEAVASIKAKIKEVTETLSNGINAILDKIQKNVDWQTKMINVNPSMTSRQKENAKTVVDADGARQNVAALDAQLRDLWSNYDKLSIFDKGDYFLKNIMPIEQQKRYNEELAKVPSLLDDIHRSSKQALEDGLVTFLTDGINEAENIKEAFLDLVESILKSIQQVFAKKITDDLMNKWFKPDEISYSRGESQPKNTKAIFSFDYNFAPQYAAQAEQISSSFNGISSNFGNFVNDFSSTGSTFLVKTQTFFSGVIQTMQSATNLIPSINSGSTSTTSNSSTDVQHNALGGYISGPGTGTSDSILSYLSNGEFVVRADAVRKVATKYGPNFLHRLNSGDINNLHVSLPKFATGGYVGRAGSQGMSNAMEIFTANLSTGVSPRLNVNNYVDGQRIFDTYGRSLIKSEVRKEYVENAKFYSQINKRMK